MGQRHQLFVIARIEGRYRCVAAFHSQWIWGHAVLAACARLLRAFANPFNAAAIASELAAAKQYPYLVGLFLSVFRLERRRLRMFSLSVLRSNTVPSTCQNDEGYTCFDLTEPAKPRYCFWSWARQPLDSVHYLEPYDLVDLAPEEDYELVESTELVSLAALAETWPSDFQVDLSAGDNEDAEPSVEPQILENGGTLAMLAVRTAVQAFLQSDSTDTVAFAQTLQPHHTAALREELLKVATSLGATGVALLALLLKREHEPHVNLRPWLQADALHANQLHLLQDALQHVETLDLSGSSSLTADIVQSLVPNLPGLRHLFAFGCPNLGPLTVRLPLTTFLATAPLAEAVRNKQTFEQYMMKTECIRVATPEDAPPGLTVYAFSEPLASHSLFSLNTMYPGAARVRVERQGIELAHCGAEGVVRGLNTLLTYLYGEPALCDSTPFFLRAAFHAIGTLPLTQSVVEGSTRANASEPLHVESFGCLPSLANDGEDDGRDLSAAPRHPGWTLVLDVRGPPPRNLLAGLVSLVTVRPGARGPAYAFVRWAHAAGPDGRLVACEALSVRGWANLQKRDGGAAAGLDAALAECDRLISVAHATLLSVESADRVRARRREVTQGELFNNLFMARNPLFAAAI